MACLGTPGEAGSTLCLPSLDEGKRRTFTFLPVLGTEPGALRMLSWFFAVELHSTPSLYHLSGKALHLSLAAGVPKDRNPGKMETWWFG